MQLKYTICIEAPNNKVWQYLAEVGNIHLWIESIRTSSTENTQTSGVGTIRVCQIGKKDFKEKFTSWEEGKSYTYEALNPPAIMKYAENSWRLSPENGKTLLTSEPKVIFKGGILGYIFEFLMRPMINKQMAEALAAFKFLVENGQPYQGKPSKLPRGPLTC